MSVSGFSWPSPRHDEWRWTPIGRLSEAASAPPQPSGGLPLAATSGLRVVIGPNGIDGALSTIDALKSTGVHCRSGGLALADHDDPISAFVSGLSATGWEIDIDAGAAPPPIELLWCHGTGKDSPILGHHLRITLRRGATATLIERSCPMPGASSLEAQMRCLNIEPDAHLRRVTIEPQAPNGRRLSREMARLGHRSSLNDVLMTQGGRLTRHERHMHLDGERIQVNLCGIMMPSRDDHAHLLTYAHHHAPHSQSRQVLRSVASGKAQAAFQGRICVDHGANGTDASQNHKGLLLDSSASIHTKPELEINADDVRCAHGAAVGALDADALFYMQARGIPTPYAKRLLTDAFVWEALEPIASLEEIVAPARATLLSWMGWPPTEEDA